MLPALPVLFTAALCQTDTSKVQVTTEEEQGAQSWKKKFMLRAIIMALSKGKEDLIEMHECCRQAWVQLSRFWNLNSKLWFKIYSTHWSCKRPQFSRSSSALRLWLNYKACKRLSWLYWAAFVCFLVLWFSKHTKPFKKGFIENHKISYEFRYLNS